MGLFSWFSDNVLGIDPPRPPAPPPAPKAAKKASQIAQERTMSLERMVAYSRRGGRKQLVTEQDVGMRLS